MMFRRIFNRQMLTMLTAMLLAIGMVVWWYAKPDSRLNKAASQVMEIAESVHRHYIGKAGYWGLNTRTAVENKILANSFYKGEGLENALGKPILIGNGANGDTVMPGEKSFDIVYEGLSLPECIALATYHYEQSKTLGLLQVTIDNGATRQSFGWGDETYSLPVSRPTAKKFCAKNAKVIWTME